MLCRHLLPLIALFVLGAAWGCGSSDSGNTPAATGGAAGAAGTTAGAAGDAGSAGQSGQGGSAGQAGQAGAAGQGGAAGTAGTAGNAGQAGGAGSGTCSPNPADHTDCQTGGGQNVGHLPGKEQAKTTCVSCHTPDLGKNAADNCWQCHAPTGSLNPHNKKHGGKSHMQAADPTNASAANPSCAPCHVDNNTLAGNTCSSCH